MSVNFYSEAEAKMVQISQTKAALVYPNSTLITFTSFTYASIYNKKVAAFEPVVDIFLPLLH